MHHADGVDAVPIRDCGPELRQLATLVLGRTAPEGDEATGFSPNLSFDEAFRDAVAGLPPLEPGRSPTSRPRCA